MISFVGETGLQIFEFSSFWIFPLLLIGWIATIVGLVVTKDIRSTTLLSIILPSIGIYLAILFVVRFGQARWDFLKPLAHMLKE